MSDTYIIAGQAAVISGGPAPVVVVGPEATAGEVITSIGNGEAEWEPGGGGGGNATEIQGVPVSASSPATNQALIYNGTEYVPTTISVQAGPDYFTQLTYMGS